MNLTYEIIENGYVILNDGVKWIEQTGFIPYPGATMEESAQKHIAALTADASNAAQAEEEMQSLEDRLTLAEEMLMEIMLNGVNA